MSKTKSKDVVGVYRVTFSDTYRDAIEHARRSGDVIASVEVAPPFQVVLTKDGEVEFRSRVRILYSEED